MARRRAQHASLALTSNGIVLVNALSFLNEKQATQLRARLQKGFGTNWFFGVPLAETDLPEVLTRFDDAGAEAAARILKSRSRATRPRRSSARKRNP